MKKNLKILLILIITCSVVLCGIVYYYHSNNVLVKIDRYLKKENLSHIEKYDDVNYIFATYDNDIIGGFIDFITENEHIYLTLDHKKFNVD